MEDGFSATGQTLDALLGPIGQRYLDFVCAKWRIRRYEWRTGDDLPEPPLDAATLAVGQHMTPSEVRNEDRKMVETFGPAVQSDPKLVKVQFAGVPIKEARGWWEKNFGHQ